jgi:hypothetical protein
MARLAGALFGALAIAVVACGGAASSFPEELACPAPSPLPTSGRNPGSISPNRYQSSLQNSATDLERLRAGLRATYPEDTFYRREEFRPDFARYASETVCTAQMMFDVDPPDARFSEYDANLDAVLQELIAHTRAGREAVRVRNVSDYRDWFKEVDGKIVAVRQAANARAE